MRFRKGRVSVSARGLSQAYLQAGAQSRREGAQEWKGPILARQFRALAPKMIGGVCLTLCFLFCFVLLSFIIG